VKNIFRQRRAVRLRRVSLKHSINDIILVYRLVSERRVSVSQGIKAEEIYSMSITKISDGGKAREVKYLRDITRNEEVAKQLFKKVSRGCVTPCTAEEIVADLIGCIKER